MESSGETEVSEAAMADKWAGEIDVWAALDIGKSAHHGMALTNGGDELIVRPVPNTEQEIRAYLSDARVHGTVALVIDQPGSIGQLALAVAADMRIPVAYIPGLVMRRAAELYPGEAKIDPRDSFVIADTARIHQKRIAVGRRDRRSTWGLGRALRLRRRPRT